jgi:hypothetical protein
MIVFMNKLSRPAPTRLARASMALTAEVKARKARAKEILDHIEAAKARKSGVDITNFSEEELIADLRLHTRIG